MCACGWLGGLLWLHFVCSLYKHANYFIITRSSSPGRCVFMWERAAADGWLGGGHRLCSDLLGPSQYLA